MVVEIQNKKIVASKTDAYDVNDDGYRIKSVQKKFRDSFSSASLDDSKWESIVGIGTSLSQSVGNLTMVSGVTANSEISILSKETFTVPFRVGVGLTLSQRIANQSFLVEAVSVDPNTLIPDGKHCAALLFDGTTTTQGKYRVQNGGLTPLDSSAQTVPTTGGAGFYEVEVFADEAWFHGGTIDSTSARTNSYRRHQQIPDPNALYKIRLRWLNGSTAPASSTNAIVNFLAVQDYAELTAEITAGRGQTVAGQAIGVQVVNSVAISGNPAVVGNAAHDATISGNPVRTAGRAVTSNYTAVAGGDVADLITTVLGVQIEKPYSIPEADWQVAPSAVTVITDIVLKATGGASLRNYVTGIQMKNVGAVDTEVVIKDGSTVIWRGFLKANMITGDVINFTTPLRGTLNTAMNFACLTAANVYISAQGYQAP
jgi:hypothetical protein